MYSVLQTTTFRTPALMKECVVDMKLIKDQRTLSLICVAKLQGTTLDQSCDDGMKHFFQPFVFVQFENVITSHDTLFDKLNFRNSCYSRHT